MKKTICIFLCLGLMLSTFVSCTGKAPSDVTGSTSQAENTTEPLSEPSDGNVSENVQKLILPYCKSDSLNPYKSVSQLNLRLESLLFDGLYTLDEGFAPVGVIAESEETGSEQVTVKIKSGLTFSDNTSLTAEDVVYSFSLAKKGKYSEMLTDISGATAVNSHTVKFTLSQPDIFILSSLIFPVIPKGQGNSDSPSGSGRYYLSGDERLKYNPSRFQDGYPYVKTVYLSPAAGSASDTDSLRIGNISVLFSDMRDCTVERPTAGIYNVSLDSLVFLGLNSENPLLSDKALRKAIGIAIDRQAVADNDYHGYASAAQTPFEPHWYRLPENIEPLFSQSEAVRLLELDGYKYPSDTAQFRTNEKKKKLTFTLLVNKTNIFRQSAANSIKKYLSSVGIGVTVKAVSDEEYFKLIKSGSFDMYIGEVKLCPNMSLRPFLDGEASKGIDLEAACFSTYAQLLDGSSDIGKFINDFNESMPFVPLCFRQGVLMASNSLSGNIEPLCTDLFHNIHEWSFKE